MCQVPHAPLQQSLLPHFAVSCSQHKVPLPPAPHFLHSFSDSDDNGAKVEQMEPGLVPAVRFCPPKQDQEAPFITSHNTVHNWKESIKLYLSMNSFSPWF